MLLRVIDILTWEEIFGLIVMGSLIVGPPVLFLGRLVECWRGSAAASRRRTFFWGMATVIVALCALYGYFLEPRWVEYRTIRLPIRGVPADRVVRLVHLTDFHYETRALGWPGEQVLARIASMMPDLICLTGDYLNDAGEAAAFRLWLEKLRQMAPTYAVLGNWDFHMTRGGQLVKDVGIPILDGSWVDVAPASVPLRLLGIPLWSEMPGVESGAFQTDQPVVVLYHTPDRFPDAAAASAALYLAGHTHGGQVCLPLYGPVVTLARTGRKYASGLYKSGDTWGFTGRGLGMEGGHAPRIRFCARPQVTLIELAAPGTTTPPEPDGVADPVELLAVILGFINVWLIIRQSVWCWPPGLLSTGLYVFIFYQARLYSETILQLLFIVLQLHGWYYWVFGGRRSDEASVPVTRLTVAQRVKWAVGTLILAAALGTAMKTWTNADLPYLDALVTAMSISAQILMNVKVLESWLLWITVDIFSIGIYYVKGLTFTLGLYTAFLIMATMGYFAWRRSFLDQKPV
ncbi:MAG TPA: nicotinamide riboside transporter PnuC [Candidatus Ozemobacteraceae bacterium]|nr:nicotinamide riboside transporter PnuC [Candidatus Ozemobacteraceae bacterium]